MKFNLDPKCEGLSIYFLVIIHLKLIYTCTLYNLTINLLYTSNLGLCAAVLASVANKTAGVVRVNVYAMSCHLS